MADIRGTSRGDTLLGNDGSHTIGAITGDDVLPDPEYGGDPLPTITLTGVLTQRDFVYPA